MATRTDAAAKRRITYNVAFQFISSVFPRPHPFSFRHAGAVVPLVDIPISFPSTRKLHTDVSEKLNCTARLGFCDTVYCLQFEQRPLLLQQPGTRQSAAAVGQRPVDGRCVVGERGKVGPAEVGAAAGRRRGGGCGGGIGCGCRL